MEERKLTEKESVDLIAAMIADTRHKLSSGAGNMLLFWGYLCVGVALLQYLLMYLHYGMNIDTPFYGRFVWWLIPVIGIPYTLIVNRRNAISRKVTTYTDRLSISLWNYVLWLACAAMVIGVLFFVSGFNVWYVMMLFAFFVVGMAVSMQGLIIKRKSLVVSGAFSVVCGGFLVAGIITGASWLMTYSVPLFILAFISMMIVPGHILNYKAKQQ